MSENGEIYTAGKNFTLPPAVTNSTSASNTLNPSHVAARGWTTDAKVEEDGFDPAHCEDIAKQLVSPVLKRISFDSSSNSSCDQSLINYASNLQKDLCPLSISHRTPV